MPKKIMRFVFGKQKGNITNEEKTHFRRALKDWDRLATLTCLIIYSLFSLFGRPISVLRNSVIPEFWVNLLMIELLVGCSMVIFGIFTRLYRPQFIGAVIALFAIGIQFVLSVLVDGFTTGDFFVLTLFFAIFALVRRVKWRQKTSNEILRVHEIVDQVAQEIQTDAASGDEKGK